jgi:thiamine biosynthesis lipoprotein
MRLFRTVFHAMASEHELQLWCDDEARARRAADAAIADVARVEAKYSRYRDDSVVSRINASAGSDSSVLVDVETAGLLDFAGRLFELSNGLFDITSGALRHAWDFRRARIPFLLGQALLRGKTVFRLLQILLQILQLFSRFVAR